MEIILEIEIEEAEKLGINQTKISFEELKRKITGENLKKALNESYANAVKHGYNDMNMEEINNMIKEAKESYKKNDDKNSD